MSAEALIVELVSRWEELRSRGEDTSVESLCRDHPELIPSVEEAIARRQAESTDVTTDWSGESGQESTSGGSFGESQLGYSVDDVETEQQVAGLGSPRSPEEIGRIGPFRVIKRLGVGGMGEVYQAIDSQLGRAVALKVLRPRLAGSEVARQRFLREARAAAAFEHDHVITIYQVGEENGVPYLAMPLLRGQSLSDRLHGAVKLPYVEILRIGREIAEGLAAAHDQDLIHRDIKPANIWLEEGSRRVKLLDFGLARTAEDAGRLTQDGAILGTPAFMSPEQASGAHSVDFRSDLFSLGCVLYRMAAGRPPFVASSHPALLMALTRVEPVPPRELNSEISTELDDLIVRLLAKDPAKRPRSAREVAGTLQSLECACADRAAAPAPALAIEIGEEAPGSAVLRPVPRAGSAGKRAGWIAAAVGTLLLGGAVAAGLLWRAGVIERNNDRGVLTRAVAVPPTNPARAAAPTWPPPPATIEPWPTPPADDPLPGLIPQPRRLENMGRWQIETRRPRKRVTSVAWNPQRGLIACASTEPVVRIYQTQDLALVGVLVAAGTAVDCLGWSPDGSRLAGGCDDGSVRLWAVDGTPGPVFRGHRAAVTHVTWRPDGLQLATSSRDGSVRIWQPGGEPGPILDHAAAVTSVAWSPDGTNLASACDSHHVHLWSAAGKAGPVLKGHAAAVSDVAWNPSGTVIASSGGAPGDFTIRLWSPDGTPGPVLNGHTARVNGLAWSPDGARLASGGDNRSLRLWNRDGTAGPVIAAGTSVNSLSWSPDGKQLVTGGQFRDLRLWDADGAPRLALPGYPLVTAFAPHPEGHRLASACQGDQAVLLWGSTAAPGPLLKGHTLGVLCLAWSPDGRQLASGSADKSLRIWTASGTPGPAVPGHEDELNALAWSRDGRRIASGSTDKTVRIWEADGSPGPVLKGSAGAIRAVAWSPDGQQIAAAGLDGTIRRWGSDGSPRETIARYDVPTSCVGWSPDGQRIAAGVQFRELQLWGNNGAAGPVLRDAHGAIVSLAWHRDSARLAVGGPQPAVRLWDINGLAGPVLVPGAGSDMRWLAFVAGGETLVASGRFGYTRAWNTRTLATEWVAFQPTRFQVAVFSGDGRVLQARPVAMNHFVYLVEQPDRKFELLTPAQFNERAGHSPGEPKPR